LSHNFVHGDQSFGINVAQLAGLPEEVLANAKNVSEEFEEEMNGTGCKVNKRIEQLSDKNASEYVQTLKGMLETRDMTNLRGLWEQLQSTN
jgi:DNA mismatch repair ATPase MutS